MRMMPIAEPMNLIYLLILTIALGTPTGILSLAVFLALEQLPSPRARTILPAIGALAVLIVTLYYFHGEQTPVQYQETWLLMMVTGFLMPALAILAPFPFLRRYFRYIPPSGVIYFTALSTIFILVSTGVMGGDAVVPPATDLGRILGMVSLACEECIAATLVYGGLAVLEGMYSLERNDPS
jgi:hypothetical protein